MDNADRQAIDDIFRRLEEVERTGPPRDAEAEAMIQDRMRQRPAYAYYLAQTVVAQQQGLEAAQARLDALERRSGQAQTRAGEGGFLSRIFSGGDGRGRTSVPASPAYNPQQDPRYDPRYAGRRPGMGGGGFLAGAAQTAVGVAGGVILGNMLFNAFDGDEAQAAEPQEAADTAADDGGGGDMGDGGFGDFEF